MPKTLEESRAFFKADAFAMEACGITIDRVSPGEAQCSMPLRPGVLNAGKVAQGGAVFTLCDTAFAVAANQDGPLVVSQGANISFLRPGAGSRLRALAREISAGKSTCVYSVHVYDDRERLVAYATITGFRKAGKE